MAGIIENYWRTISRFIEVPCPFFIVIAAHSCFLLESADAISPCHKVKLKKDI